MLIDWCCKKKKLKANKPAIGPSRDKSGGGARVGSGRRRVGIGRKWADWLGNSVLEGGQWGREERGGRSRSLVGASACFSGEWLRLRLGELRGKTGKTGLERGEWPEGRDSGLQDDSRKGGSSFFIRGCEWPKSARCGSLPAPVAGPSARSRARSKFQGKEGRAGRGRRAQLPARRENSAALRVEGTYRRRRRGGTLEG